MKPCPRCDAEIGNTAVACRCGWKERAAKTKDEPVVFMQCAHMGCNISASCRVKTPTGWADFCLPHYEKFYENKCLETCDKLGLKTMVQRREWLNNNPLLVKRVPFTREPGEDLDEVAA